MSDNPVMQCARPVGPGGDQSGDEKLRETGCRETVESLYRREYPRVYRYLAAKVGGEAAADLAHDVFIRAATSPALGQVDNPGAWLTCIARNLVIDRNRRNDCRIQTFTLTDDDLAHVEPDQESGLLAEELAGTLSSAIAALPDRTRQIFLQSRVAQMTYREIQVNQGLSLAAVEYHMMKALASLRTEMNGPLAGPGQKNRQK